MSKVHPFPNQKDQAEDQRLDQACTWITRLDRGLSKNEKKQLADWLAQHPNNPQVFIETAQMWDKMDDLQRLSDLFPHHKVKPAGTAKWASAMAASVLLLLAVSWFNQVPFLTNGSQESSQLVWQSSYQTKVGQNDEIVLPDNSKLILNTNSIVNVRYSSKARIIELEQGELHIDVAHSKTRPLTVIAAGKAIQAVGTAFNVQLEKDIVELIVTDGKVIVAEPVEDLSVQEELNYHLTQLPDTIAVSKGEKVDIALVDDVTEQVEEIRPAEVAASLSWRSGNLIFRGETLAEAMAEISRYTDVQIELANNTDLQQVKVAGVFKTGDVDGLLKVLKSNFNINHHTDANGKVMLSLAG